MKLLDGLRHNSHWRIERFASEADFRLGQPYSVSEFEGNLLLNEGIDEVEKLICGMAGTAYSNANAYLGVGDGTAAEDASQTGLQGTNKSHKGMDSGYPTVGSQVMTFKATFGTGDGNHSWQEFTVVNASTDAGKNLNRKVSDQGTKVSGQIWTLTLTITLS